MNSNVRIIVGLSLVIIGFFWNDIQERIPDFSPDVPLAIEIVEPTDDIKKATEFASVVTDPTDKLNLTVFNKIFADRCVKYKATNQNINDVYTLAAKNFFGNSLNGKYDGYGENLVDTMKSVIGDEVHELSNEEKQKLSQTFMGLAWQTNN